MKLRFIRSIKKKKKKKSEKRVPPLNLFYNLNLCRET